MRVIIAGGGTGGHLFPAVALGEELGRRVPGLELLYAGSRSGLEARWLPAHGLPFVGFEVRGFRGHSLPNRLLALGELLRAVGQALALVKRFSADLVVGAGGYASLPLALAATLRGVPLVLMEQNVRPGLVNRVLARFARLVCVGFPEAAAFFPPERVRVTGNPVRFGTERFAAADQSESSRPSGRLSVLVLGGSSGAHRLNLAASAGFEALARRNLFFEIVHQTGFADEALIRDAYRRAGISATVIPFIEDMAGALAHSDLVISRAGAMAISEIALAGRPAILVPYPFHRDRQQEHNAQVLVRRNAALMVDDDERLAQSLALAIEQLVAQPERLRAMGKAARTAAFPDAASTIATLCLKLVEPRARPAKEARGC